MMNFVARWLVDRDAFAAFFVVEFVCVSVCVGFSVVCLCCDNIH